MTANEVEAARVIGKIGKVARVTGIAGEVLVIGANGYNVWTNPTSENIARAGVAGFALGLNAVNFLVPGLGTGLSLGVSAIDAAGGFNWLYNSFNVDKTP
jgi:hypothetical protein